jgi:hypothetical protein
MFTIKNWDVFGFVYYSSSSSLLVFPPSIRPSNDIRALRFNSTNFGAISSIVQDTTFTCDMHMKDVTERSTVLVVLLPSNMGPQCAISPPYSGTQVRRVNYLAPNFGRNRYLMSVSAKGIPRVPRRTSDKLFTGQCVRNNLRTYWSY